MNKRNVWRALISDTSGAGMLEYGLLVALMISATTVILGAAGTFFMQLFNGLVLKVAPYWIQ